MNNAKRLEILNQTHTYLSEKLGNLYKAFPVDDVPVELQRKGYVNYGTFSAKIDDEKIQIKCTLKDLESQIRSVQAEINSSQKDT